MSSFQIASVFAVLVDAAVRGTLILGAALLATRLMRRRSAASRHLVWVVALAAVLVLPLVTRALPAWRVVPLPAPLRPAAVFVAAPRLPAAAPRQAAAEPAPPPVVSTAITGSPARVSSPPQPSTTAATPVAFDWKNALLVLWAVGGALLVARLLFGLGRVWWMQRRAIEITDEGWVDIADRLARRLRVGRMVTLLRESHAVVPMTWGIVRPVVLLPAGAEQWGVERRTVVLAHELAHVRRWDPLTQWLAHLALALFWFHPLVWVAARSMREEREHACDDAVLSIGTRPVAYADHLLEIVRSLGAHEGPAAALAMARRSQFEGRLLAILDNATPRGGVSRGLGLAALVVAAAAVLPLAALRAAVPAPVPQQAAGAAPRTPAQSPAERSPAASPSLLHRLAGNVGELIDHAAGTVAGKPAQPASEGAAAPSPPAPAPAAAGPAPVPSVADSERAAWLARELHLSGDSAAALLQPGGGYAEVIRAAEGITSSGDRSSVLLAVLRRPDLSAGDLVLLLRCSEGITSSGDRSAVLRAAVARTALLTPAVRSALMSSLNGISSDGDRRSVLMALLGTPGATGETLSHAISSTRSLVGDASKRDVLLSVLGRPGAGPTQYLEVVNATAGLVESATKRDLLITVLGKRNLTPAVLTAVFNVTAGMVGSAMQRDVLLTAASQQRIEGAVRDAYLAAAGAIVGSSERAAAIAALLGDGAAAAEARPAREGRTTTTSTTSTLHNHDGEDGEWSSEVELTSTDGSQLIRANVLHARVGASHSDIRSIDRGGYVRVEETLNGVTRRLEIVPGPGGALLRTYSVDGRRQPFDASVQRWFAGVVRRFTGD